VKLATTASVHNGPKGDTVHVRIKNPSQSLAFQVQLAVEAGNPADEVVPVLWEDNYVSLLPGEERVIEAKFPGRRSIGPAAKLKVGGWNIEPEQIQLGPAGKSTATKKK
jgi:exo-1,4-beta-D-glucosaminidase